MYFPTKSFFDWSSEEEKYLDLTLNLLLDGLEKCTQGLISTEIKDQIEQLRLPQGFTAPLAWSLKANKAPVVLSGLNRRGSPHHGWIFLREHIQTEARGTESRTSTVQLRFSLESVFLSLLSAKRRDEWPLICYTSYKQFDTEPLAPCCSQRKTDAFQWRPKEKKNLWKWLIKQRRVL